MRVLVAGDFSIEWRAPAWARGLRELGVAVSEYDWRQDYSSGLVGYLERRFLIGPGICRINQTLLSRARETSPDVILIYAGEPITPSTVRLLASSHWVTGYHNDDPFGPWGTQRRFLFYRQSLPYYNSHHAFRQVNVGEYQRSGCSRVKLLQHFYLPWLHHPASVTERERDEIGADVIFAGNGAVGGRRVKYLAALIKEGIQVRIYGGAETWHRTLPRWALRSLPPIFVVSGIDYVKVLCSAKICPVFFNPYNRDQYTVRSFEIPACGAFMLSERTDAMQELFTEGCEAVYFDSEAEFVIAVCHYLENPEERLRIAEAGRKRCLNSGYDVISRMRQWFSDIEEWMRDTE